MAMKQIYKNLWFDEESGRYEFIDEKNRQNVVSQESYLLIYILEQLQILNKDGGFVLSNK